MGHRADAASSRKEGRQEHPSALLLERRLGATPRPRSLPLPGPPDLTDTAGTEPCHKRGRGRPGGDESRREMSVAHASALRVRGGSRWAHGASGKWGGGCLVCSCQARGEPKGRGHPAPASPVPRREEPGTPALALGRSQFRG